MLRAYQIPYAAGYLYHQEGVDNTMHTEKTETLQESFVKSFGPGPAINPLQSWVWAGHGRLIF